MTKVIQCPNCAVMAAFRKAIIDSKSKRPLPPEIRFCNRCNGSGRVLDDRDKNKREKKRRKDMSGEEWDAEERAMEWDRYITFERIIE